MLSRSEFGKLAKTVREGGGFSINVNTGEAPKEGYMVAAKGSKETKIPAPKTYGPQLEAYAQSNRKELSRSDRYMGAWGGRYYASLDVAQNIAPKKSVADKYGRDVAMADAKTSTMDVLFARNEEAAYDLQKDDDLPNPVYNPDRPKNTPGQ